MGNYQVLSSCNKTSCNKTSGWSVSRILSSGSLRLCSHLSGRRVTTSLGAAYPGLALPTRGKGTCEDEQSPIVHRRFRPCLALLPAGVTWPHALLRAPVVSYTTFSPSPPHLFAPLPKGRGVGGEGSCLFLWPFSGRFTPFSVFPSQVTGLPRPGCYPTPCSMECGLSSIPTTQDRDCPTSLSKFMIHAREAPVNIECASLF